MVATIDKALHLLLGGSSTPKASHISFLSCMMSHMRRLNRYFNLISTSLKTFFVSPKDIHEEPDNLIALPCCGDWTYLCKQPEDYSWMLVRVSPLLDMIRKYEFSEVLLDLEELPLDFKRANEIVELLRFSPVSGAMNDLIHYASLHLTTPISCSSFIAFLKTMTWATAYSFTYVIPFWNPIEHRDRVLFTDMHMVSPS